MQKFELFFRHSVVYKVTEQQHGQLNGILDLCFCEIIYQYINAQKESLHLVHYTQTLNRWCDVLYNMSVIISVSTATVSL